MTALLARRAGVDATGVGPSEAMLGWRAPARVGIGDAE